MVPTCGSRARGEARSEILLAASLVPPRSGDAPSGYQFRRRAPDGRGAKSSNRTGALTKMGSRSLHPLSTPTVGEAPR
jgi:hypothetical protein